MKTRRFLSWTCCALILNGCAIYPQPSDVTGVSTADIVQRIRCETREALYDLTLTFLQQEAKAAEPPPEVSDFLDKYNRGEYKIYNVRPNMFKGRVRYDLELFWTAGIAYNFNLDMTETNNIGGNLDFLSVVSRRTFGIGLSGSVDRTRQNTRTFTLTDSFGDLMTQTPLNCTDRIVGPNYLYPIAGKIGVQDVVATFIFLTMFGNLGGAKAPVFPKGPPTMVEALSFTTTLSGSVNPTVTFAPIGRNLYVSSAGVDIAASRKDIHQVVIGLALQSAWQAQLTLARENVRMLGIPAGGATVAGRLLTASGNAAELAAAAAVDQYLTQKLFSPTINITP